MKHSIELAQTQIVPKTVVLDFPLYRKSVFNENGCMQFSMIEANGNAFHIQYDKDAGMESFSVTKESKFDFKGHLHAFIEGNDNHASSEQEFNNVLAKALLFIGDFRETKVGRPTT